MPPGSALPHTAFHRHVSRRGQVSACQGQGTDAASAAVHEKRAARRQAACAGRGEASPQNAGRDSLPRATGRRAGPGSRGGGRWATFHVLRRVHVAWGFARVAGRGAGCSMGREPGLPGDRSVLRVDGGPEIAGLRGNPLNHVRKRVPPCIAPPFGVTATVQRADMAADGYRLVAALMPAPKPARRYRIGRARAFRGETSARRAFQARFTASPLSCAGKPSHWR